MTLGLPFWPLTLQPLALVASPRLRLRHVGHIIMHLFRFFVDFSRWLVINTKFPP
jgi:hypothetical protein